MKDQGNFGAENKPKRHYKQAPRSIMPGLIPDVVRQFRYSGKGKNLRLTPRAVQEDTGLHATAVQGSLFHELFDRIESLERLTRPAATEYRTPFITRRPAA